MARVPVIIDEPPRSVSGKASAWLRGRRIMLAAGLALLEVLCFLIWRPGAIASTLAAALVLVLAVTGIGRLQPGLARDLLWIVAIAQALVVALPLIAIGISLLAGTLIVLGVLAAIVVIAFRLRF
jgi:hypothetical protein